MNRIIEMQSGSKVYGTDLPTSDTDYKFIFLPSAKDLVLQRAKTNIQDNRKKETNERNTEKDIDREGFSLQQYIKLLTQGQTLALDMLFTPANHYTYLNSNNTWLWTTIKRDRKEFISKKVQAFVGYCRAQAGKYGIKGARLIAVNLVVSFLEDAITLEGTRTPLSVVLPALLNYCEGLKITEFAKMRTEFNPRTGHIEDYFECCGKMSQLGLPLIDALRRYQGIKDRYGSRSQAAAQENGVDTKALYHAVRIGKEAEELLATGNITFPRPEKELLLNIRKGNLEEQYISEIIDESLANIETLLVTSTLPDEPNYQFIEDFIFEVHSDTIKVGI